METKYGSFSCELCKRGFSNTDDLQAHDCMIGIEISREDLDLLIRSLKHSIRMNQQTLPDPNYRDPYLDFASVEEREKFQREVAEKFNVGRYKIEKKEKILNYLSSLK